MTTEELRGLIVDELTQDSGSVRSLYLRQFKKEIVKFTDHIVAAYAEYKILSVASKGDKKKAYVSAILYNAITLQIISMKLFLNGYTIPSGNLFRQAIEGIALALLCSAHDLKILERFMGDKYSSNDAITDLIRHFKKLSLDRTALKPLKEAREYYHRFSHLSKESIVISMSFSQKGKGYLGVSFDHAKIDRYKWEIANRVNLAEVLSDVVISVKSNVGQW
jgi:hypothetical protein